MFKKYLIKIYKSFIGELKSIVHDNGVLLFVTFLPLAYPIIYALIYNQEVARDIKMIVVDQDCSQMSRELVRELEATPEIKCIGYAADMNEAKDALFGDQCFGILFIPDKFGQAINRGEQANAVIYSDMSLMLRYKSFLIAATNVAQSLGAELQQQRLAQTSQSSNGDMLPIISVTEGNTASGFDSFLMPGVVVLILHQCLLLAIGMIGGGRHERYKQRCLTAIPPLRRVGFGDVSSSIIGRTLSYLLLMMFPTIFLLCFVPYIFSFPMQSSMLQIMCYIFPMMLACIFLGFTIQYFVWEREAIMLVLVVMSVIFIFISGLTWPRFAMAPIWQTFGACVPATWGIDGLIRINAVGASMNQVMHSFMMLWILAGAYLITAYFAEREMLRKNI